MTGSRPANPSPANRDAVDRSPRVPAIVIVLSAEADAPRVHVYGWGTPSAVAVTRLRQTLERQCPEIKVGVIFALCLSMAAAKRQRVDEARALIESAFPRPTPRRKTPDGGWGGLVVPHGRYEGWTLSGLARHGHRDWLRTAASNKRWFDVDPLWRSRLEAFVASLDQDDTGRR